MSYSSLNALYPKHPSYVWTCLIYVLLCGLLMWPLWSGHRLHGAFTVDMADTLYFQRAFFQYWTEGISSEFSHPADLWPWLPNVIDHLTFMPFMLLPFPWSNHLWWLCIWSSGGCAAHYAAKKLGGTQANAFLCGLSWMLSEPILRELNLFHAPQSMTMLMPLFLAALINWSKTPSPKLAFRVGFYFALCALIYWYNALFLSLILIPPLFKTRDRSLFWAFFPIVLLCAYPLWSYLSLQSPLIAQPLSPDIQPLSQWFVSDRSHRFSLVLGAACLLHCRKQLKDLPWLLVMTLAFLLSSGGWLWTSIQSLHPILERLHWPVRWSILLPLAMLPILNHIKRPLWWGAFFIIESWFTSPNLPLDHTQLQPYQCLSQLSELDGAILEVGYNTPRQRPWIALHQRLHNRPVVGALAIPPTQMPSQEWQDWNTNNPWDDRFSGRINWTGGDVQALSEAGVQAILLIPPPLSALTQAEYNRYRLQISTRLGAAVELGCAQLWWTGQTQIPIQRLNTPEPRSSRQHSIIERLDSFEENGFPP